MNVINLYELRKLRLIFLNSSQGVIQDIQINTVIPHRVIKISVENGVTMNKKDLDNKDSISHKVDIVGEKQLQYLKETSAPSLLTSSIL